VAHNSEERNPSAKKEGELDPKVIWQEALAKGVEDPGLIIACADFLALSNKWDHAAEFLKADIRHGILVKPWVYQALAVALRQTKASAEEIERAEVSAADLEPLDAQGFLRAAEAMRQAERPDRALAFCRQAALLQPNVPYAFRDALVCAKEAKDSAGMAWAAGNLLQRDWPVDNEKLQDRATKAMDNLSKELMKDKRTEEAGRLKAALEQHQQRDLVIRLAWQDTADLDLRVEEPSGSTCSWLNRQTVGGGTLLGDTLTETNNETYVAARAFSGVYKVTVDRVWGRPLGGRAQLQIIHHQGTPQQQVDVVTVNVGEKQPVTVTLENGRRTEPAAVPPPAALELPRDREEEARTSQVLTQLRNLADPEISSVDTGIRGGFSMYGTPSRPQLPTRMPERSSAEQLAYQTKVASPVGNSAALTTRASLTADRNFVRLSLSPLFDTLKNGRPQAAVYNPLIPGAPRP
jgi:tetratricopeptide (TPR) repeat protein